MSSMTEKTCAPLLAWELERLSVGSAPGCMLSVRPDGGLGICGTGRAAIAVTIIGGQSLCLFLTLLLVPVAYVKFDALEQAALSRRWKDMIGRLKASIGLRPAPAP